jgi:hypothetical protein
MHIKDGCVRSRWNKKIAGAKRPLAVTYLENVPEVLNGASADTTRTDVDAARRDDDRSFRWRYRPVKPRGDGIDGNQR